MKDPDENTTSATSVHVTHCVMLGTRWHDT